MVDIIFNYDHIDTIIQGDFNESFNTIKQKFKKESQLDINNVNFKSNGKDIKENEKLLNIMNESEKMNKRMIISVFPINNIINKENIDIIKSKDIICLICKEVFKYFIYNYKIRLY